jgi:hypothetical protein
VLWSGGEGVVASDHKFQIMNGSKFSNFKTTPHLAHDRLQWRQLTLFSCDVSHLSPMRWAKFLFSKFSTDALLRRREGSSPSNKKEQTVSTFQQQQSNNATSELLLSPRQEGEREVIEAHPRHSRLWQVSTLKNHHHVRLVHEAISNGRQRL